MTTERLRLRRMQKNDLKDLHAILSHPDVSRYDEWEPCTLEDSEEELDKALETPLGTPDTWNMIGVELPGTGKIIGIIYLRPKKEHPDSVELGYFFHPHFHGNGYATEATTSMIQRIFSMGFHRIFSRVDPRNLPSVRLLERLGFAQEGMFPNSCFCKGEWCDEATYGLTATSQAR